MSAPTLSSHTLLTILCSVTSIRQLAWYAAVGWVHRFFAEWFAMPFPLEKLDLVAVPDIGPGANGNLGLITVRKSELLLQWDGVLALNRSEYSNGQCRCVPTECPFGGLAICYSSCPFTQTVSVCLTVCLSFGV